MRAEAAWLHVAIDKRSRLASTQGLPGERKQDATAVLNSSLAWFNNHCVATGRVMTDNGSADKSRMFAAVLHAQDQRQGRALQPEQHSRMGLHHSTARTNGRSPSTRRCTPATPPDHTPHAQASHRSPGARGTTSLVAAARAACDQVESPDRMKLLAKTKT